jgi:hypothetical protein
MSDQKAYFFLGPNYIRYDTIDDAVDPNYPRALPGGWINLPFASIDAGVNWGNGQIYFFSGNRYARVTLANNNTMDAGYPLDIAGHWPGLTFATIDAAVNLGNGKVFFFLADEYVSYDIAADHVDPGFPRKIAPDWPGLFPPGIDAAVNWGNGKAYFFAGSQYVRFDIATNRVDDGYPLATASQWPPALSGHIDAAVERFTAPATPPRCTPVFEPGYWNDGADAAKIANPKSVQKNDNCYNYATDIPNRTFAQPGQASGRPIISLGDCSDASAGATADGLTASPGGPCAGCCHSVALVLAPGFDYHWYRLDASGTWSHKPGRTPATDRDQAGNPISDPRTAARGPYTQFCGFFCACHGAMHVLGPRSP